MARPWTHLRVRALLCVPVSCRCRSASGPGVLRKEGTHLHGEQRVETALTAELAQPVPNRPAASIGFLKKTVWRDCSALFVGFSSSMVRLSPLDRNQRLFAPHPPLPRFSQTRVGAATSSTIGHHSPESGCTAIERRPLTALLSPRYLQPSLILPPPSNRRRRASLSLIHI